jgi:ketosteroid isomerase-like protein
MKTTLIKTSITLLFMVSLFAATAKGLNTIKHDSSAVKSAIDKVDKTYNQAFATGDSVLILNCYADGAVLMPPNSPVISGWNGISAFFKFSYKAGVRSVVFKTAQLFGLTDQYATEQGTYEVFDANNTILDKGKFLVVWTKTSDGWKMYRDMFSSNVPAMRPAKK